MCTPSQINSTESLQVRPLNWRHEAWAKQEKWSAPLFRSLENAAAGVQDHPSYSSTRQKTRTIAVTHMIGREVDQAETTFGQIPLVTPLAASKAFACH